MLLQQYASAEVDKAKVRSQGGDNPLGAAYNVPVGALVYLPANLKAEIGSIGPAGHSKVLMIGWRLTRK
jgi:hypothetical protein